MSTKTCGRCKLVKDVEEFALRIRRGRTERQCYCNQCAVAYNKERRSYRKNLDVTIIEKECNVCLLTKPANEFRKYAALSDMLYVCCVSCERVKEREHYANNKEVIVKKSTAYKKHKRATSPNFRLHANFRNLARKFFTSDSRGVADHRLVSKRTLERWISFQKMLNDAPDNYHLDERWPNSKFDLENPYHRLIATNVLNYCPMDPTENIKKSNKILPELLLDHLNVAESFVNLGEHSKQEALKLRYLYDMYSNFIHKQLENLLNETGILNNEIQE